jgi:uncharacterized protein
MSALLLDTGPLVACLDRADPHHKWVMHRFGSIQGHVVTTGAIITESAYFLQDVEDGIRRLADLMDILTVETWDCFAIPVLRSAHKLMAGYADTPMDFGDATLVLAAESFGIRDIATLDERRFRTFRFSRNRSFRLILQDG